ncbi:MAG: hypothetical protein Q9188_006639 [Gyalolechia gomerana]
MPRQHRGLSLPPLSSISHPPVPTQLTLCTATAPSPSSTSTLTPTTNNLPGRSGSKRLERVKALLSPILAPSATPPSTSSATAIAEEADERDGAGDAQSGIEFFERHPLDSRSPLTFLDGGCGSGDGGGREVCEEENNGRQGADDKAKNDGRGEVKQVSQSASWYDLPATPPRDIPHAKAKAMAPGHDALAGFERLDLQVHGRARRTYGEPRRTMSQLERKRIVQPRQIIASTDNVGMKDIGTRIFELGG